MFWLIRNIAMILLVWLFLVISFAESALVEPYECFDSKIRNAAFSNFVPDVSYGKENKTLTFSVHSDVFSYTPDVNASTNIFTTLHLTIGYTNGDTSNHYLRLCDYISLINAGNSTSSSTTSTTSSDSDSDSDDDICPLYSGETISINYSADISNHCVVGTYSVQMQMISSDGSGQTIGCVKMYVTPELPKNATLPLQAGIVILAGLILLINSFALIFSPYQESEDPYLFLYSTVCNAPLLNQITPGIDDFFVYVHFSIFMTGLNLQYPGFYKAFISSITWVALLTNALTPDMESIEDGIYVTYDENGLETLALYATNDFQGNVWKTFMVVLSFLILAIVAADQIFVGFSFLTKRKNSFNWKKNLYHIIGLVLRLFFFMFTMPFLVTSIYLLSGIGSSATSTYHGKKPEIWAIVLSILFLIVWVLVGLFFIFNYIFPTKRNNKNKQNLYTSMKLISIWGGLYHKYEPSKIYYFIVELLEMLFLSIIIGALQDHGAVQVITVIITEGISLMAMLYFKPYYLKTKLNGCKLVVAIVKLLTSFLLIPFVIELQTSEEAMTIVAFVQCSLHLAVLFFIFFIPVIYCLISTIQSIIRVRNGEIVSFNPLKSGSVEKEIKIPYFGADTESNNYDKTNSHISLAEMSYFENRLHSNSGGLFRNASISTSNLELTDNRVLPLVGISNISYGNNDKSAKCVDYSVREADAFFTGRILEPDPEVKQIWEAREERNTNMVPSTNNNNNNNNNNSNSIKGKKDLFKLIFRNKYRRPVKGFEVERPRQITIGAANVGNLSNTTNTNPHKTESLATRDEDAEDKNDDTRVNATPTYSAHFTEDYGDKFSTEEEN
ncbi:hypothetical protein PACTADRAFT_34893 [Pachysolen tannophilus NRRL Y-2460]|uniref:TRP C-terminal domain-containing protein n=1 Tax=Pachysolen tannophilus NRRL Y-2460 TaxID=669874 RepID=A0A1E4TQN2_PACTA|nr:hypothetical protein PACTADRAFT_34893 [Pachysolen tannophilus NRRL Y-2460]